MGNDNIDIIRWANEITIASQKNKSTWPLKSVKIKADLVNFSISKELRKILSTGLIVQVERICMPMQDCQQIVIKTFDYNVRRIK